MPIAVIILGLSIFFLITGIIEGNAGRIIGSSIVIVVIVAFALWVQFVYKKRIS